MTVQLDEAIAAIGAKLRQLRKQQNLSLEELSQRAGVSAKSPDGPGAHGDDEVEGVDHRKEAPLENRVRSWKVVK